MLAFAAPALAQAPEDRGSLTVAEWDAGSISHAGANIRTRVFYPEPAGVYPLVGVVHGANANGSYHLELAGTLASRGFVVVLPDMPCTVTSCDHDANQRQISAMLEWAVAQSGDSSSRIFGRVDGSRRGLIGHSWGGLSSHLTASRDPTIDSLVLLDPNDDGTVGRDATSGIGAPVLQLLAETPGGCNSAWQEDAVRAALTTPNLQVTLNGSGHCDPGEMDVFCSFACGSGDDATTALFRRYAVAWTSCALTGDAAMAGWIGGADMSADTSAGRLEGVFESELAAMPCRAGGLPDAGVPDVDAGRASDAGAIGDPDAGPIAMRDGGPATTETGCGCRAARADRSNLSWIALALLAVWRRARYMTGRDSATP